MQTYYLQTLLLFFQDQKNSDWEGIEIILDVLSDPFIPEEEKTGLFLAILRGYGLNETTFKNGEFKMWLEETVHDEIQAEEVPEIKLHECCAVQPIRLNLINGLMETFVPLN